MFQGRFQWVPRVFERSSKRISGKFQMWFNGVSRVFHECFKRVSRKIEECFIGVLSGIKDA